MKGMIKFLRIIIKYLRKFLATIIYMLPPVRMNFINYPFSKEFKAINQDFISIGSDFNAALIKLKAKQKQNDTK